MAGRAQHQLGVSRLGLQSGRAGYDMPARAVGAACRWWLVGLEAPGGGCAWRRMPSS